MIKILVKENNKLIKKIKFLDKFLVNERTFHFYDNVKSQSFFTNSSRETHDKRLDKTHEIFSKYISDNQKNEILDIGVSDGSTAVNLYDFLLSIDHKLVMKVFFQVKIYIHFQYYRNFSVKYLY